MDLDSLAFPVHSLASTGVAQRNSTKFHMPDNREPLLNERASSIHSFNEHDAGLVDDQGGRSSADLAACQRRLSRQFEEWASAVRDVAQETKFLDRSPAINLENRKANVHRHPTEPKGTEKSPEHATQESLAQSDANENQDTDLSLQVKKLKTQLQESLDREQHLKTALSEAQRQKQHALSTRDVLMSRGSSRAGTTQSKGAMHTATKKSEAQQSATKINGSCCELRELNDKLLDCLNDLRRRHQRALTTIDGLRRHSTGAEEPKDSRARSATVSEYPSAADMSAARQRILSRSSISIAGSDQSDELATESRKHPINRDNTSQPHKSPSIEAPENLDKSAAQGLTEQADMLSCSPSPKSKCSNAKPKVPAAADQQDSNLRKDEHVKLTDGVGPVRNDAVEDPSQSLQPASSGHANVLEAYKYATYKLNQLVVASKPPVGSEEHDQSHVHSPTAKPENDLSSHRHRISTRSEPMPRKSPHDMQLTPTASLRRQQRDRALWPSPESILLKFLEERNAVWNSMSPCASPSRSKGPRTVLA